MATAERTDLADLLATLTPEQWEAQSLCERWRVRDRVETQSLAAPLSLPPCSNP